MDREARQRALKAKRKILIEKKRKLDFVKLIRQESITVKIIRMIVVG